MALGVMFLGFLLFITTIAVIVTIIAIRARQPRVKVASCGKCRYAVEGLTVMTCPECGSDLREVGILTPNDRKRIGPAIWITLWTLLLPVPALMLTALVSSALPTVWTNNINMTLQATTPAYTTAKVKLYGDEVDAINKFERARIELERGNVSIGSPIEIDLDPSLFVSSEESGRVRADEVNAQRLVEWMATTTGEPATEFRDDADELLRAVSGAMTGRGVTVAGAFSGASVNSAVYMRQPKWFPPMALAFWIALWIGVIVFIVKRSRRKAAVQNNSRIISL